MATGLFYLAYFMLVSPFSIIKDFYERMNPLGLTSLDPTPDEADMFRDTPEMIKSRGFYYEGHHLKSRNGHQLMLHRIVNQHLNPTTGRPVVFMMPGMLTKGTIYLVSSNGQLQPDGSYVEDDGQHLTVCDPEAGATATVLAFLLANCGYDVWIAEDREMVGEPGPVDKITTNETNFWDVTSVDIALTDLPDMIDLVLAKTGVPKLNFVGFSKGASTLLILLSEQLHYNDKIDRFFGLSPVTVSHDPDFTMQMFASFLVNIPPAQVLSPFSRFRSDVVATLCRLHDSCEEIISKLFALAEFGHIDRDRVKSVVAHMPLQTSTRALTHYVQQFKSKLFQHYDYGCEDNNIIYNQSECQPPLIRLDRIQLKKMVFFYSSNDALCRPYDVDVLQQKLTVPIWRRFELPPPTLHFDYIVTPKVARKVNNEILKLLNN